MEFVAENHQNPREDMHSKLEAHRKQQVNLLYQLTIIQ